MPFIKNLVNLHKINLSMNGDFKKGNTGGDCSQSAYPTHVQYTLLGTCTFSSLKHRLWFHTTPVHSNLIVSQLKSNSTFNGQSQVATGVHVVLNTRNRVNGYHSWKWWLFLGPFLKCSPNSNQSSLSTWQQRAMMCDARHVGVLVFDQEPSHFNHKSNSLCRPFIESGARLCQQSWTNWHLSIHGQFVLQPSPSITRK